MKPDLKRFKASVGDQEIIFETGLLALQAGGLGFRIRRWQRMAKEVHVERLFRLCL